MDMKKIIKSIIKWFKYKCPACKGIMKFHRLNEWATTEMIMNDVLCDVYKCTKCGKEWI